MNWEALGAVAELVGAGAVMASLLFERAQYGDSVVVFSCGFGKKFVESMVPKKSNGRAECQRPRTYSRGGGTTTAS